MEFRTRFEGYQNKVRASFATQSMMQTFGASIDDIEPGICRISAPILELAQQQHGFAHAALTFAIGDSAAGYAALTLLDETSNVLTVEMKINLLAPAQGQHLIATGKVIKPGKKLIVVSAEVVAKDGDKSTKVALLQGTMIPI